ncbi:MAG: hypothetical protein WCG25_07390 [bacterium]
MVEFDQFTYINHNMKKLKTYIIQIIKIFHEIIDHYLAQNDIKKSKIKSFKDSKTLFKELDSQK